MASDLPCVPHLFVQRIDALPDDVLDGVLTALAQQAKEPSAPSWLQKLGWFSNHALSRADEQQSKAELRDLLQKHRRDELPIDAETADLSSEPYDSIPRQIQLQWRVYARYHAQEVAERQKLTSMLSSSPSRDTTQQGATALGPYILVGSTGSGGGSLLFGALPSVTSLQQSLQNLLPTADASMQPQSIDASMALRAGGGGATAAAAVRPAGAASGTGDLRQLHDPVYHKFSRSLEKWYELNQEAYRPLQNGRMAKLLALHGIDLPPQWTSNLRPSSTQREATTPGNSRGGWISACIRVCGRMGAVAADVVGLRPRPPRVWDVDIYGPGAQRQAQEKKQKQYGRQGYEGLVVVGPLRQGPDGKEAEGGGLVAATAAAQGMKFALRKTTLIPPEWLE